MADPAAGATTSAVSDGHRPQLDGLRALAVIMVLYSHLTPLGSQSGGYGVALFFVLSGYLITGILLRCRTLVEAVQPLALTLRQFYVRRALRIFPIVYLVLAIGWLAGDPEIRRLIWWHLAYASNFLFAMEGFSPHTAHFWSLAVEEQFYLVWPLFILVCPRRALPGAIGALILAAAAFRVAVLDLRVGVYPEMILTPSVADTLCFGALAMLAEKDTRLARMLAWGGPAAVAGVIAYHSSILPPGGGEIVVSLHLFCRGLAFAWLVGLAARGNVPGFGPLLGGVALGYIGQISYGIYVYHPFIRAIYDNFVGTNPCLGGLWPLRDGIITLASIALAAVSWHFFEAPINALKRYFPYATGGTEALARAPVGGAG